MARRVRTSITGDLAAHAHEAVGVLDRALERGGQLGDGPLGNVDARLWHGGNIGTIRGFVCRAAPVVGWAKAAKTSADLHGARSAVPTCAQARGHGGSCIVRQRDVSGRLCPPYASLPESS